MVPMMSQSPAHFSSISLRNFRGFKKAENIRLAPLTFLVGPNSSGKSSIFDAILLIIQSRFGSRPFVNLAPTWIGDLVDLGSFKDAVFGHHNSLTIGIELGLSTNDFSRDLWDRSSEAHNGPIRVGFKIRSTPDPVGLLTEIRITDVRTDEEARILYRKRARRITCELHAFKTKRKIASPRMRHIVDELGAMVQRQKQRLSGRKAAWGRIISFLGGLGLHPLAREMERVSSGRSAPKRWYAITGEQSARRVFPLGPQVLGEVTPALVEQASRFFRLSPQRRRAVEKGGSLEHHLRRIGIGTSLHIEKLSAYHSGIRVKDNVTNVSSSLIDVGYGASQAIPVIYACLSGASGPLFVEQPEIHLHPKGQAELADLLCRTSQRRQVVIETHSVHMINRARILIASGDLDPRNVAIDYVTRTRTGSHVIEIPILPNGEFGAEWPEGFFEERYQDTLELLDLKQSQSK